MLWNAFQTLLCVVVVAAFFSCCCCCHAIQIPRAPAQRFVTLARTRARYTTPVRLRQALPLMEEKSSSSSININGDHALQKLDGIVDDGAAGAAVEAVVANAVDSPEPASPPISYGKFLTMQEKRAVVTIRYSGDAGLKPYFLTMAKKLKQSHPDVIIERRILPAVVDGEATFEVLVDNKVVGFSETLTALRFTRRVQA